ncbi:4-oxalocrotonate tautomerase [Bacillus pseudomycoides]|uniref:4-oxalocrotonate tautomerase n=1 Tax=Bacillus pseudomycoides TaxID=64104 RepID=UPI001FB2D5C3|nr:4-oxalocrotonate tautomerase [Bacillus pseudomycoides]
MPIVQIQVIEGRKQEQIQNLISNVTDAVAKSFDVETERVLVNEIPGSHWGVGGKVKGSVEEK